MRAENGEHTAKLSAPISASGLAEKREAAARVVKALYMPALSLPRDRRCS